MLDSDKLGRILILAYPEDNDTYVDIYPVCKGACDKICEDRLEKRGLCTAWYDIDDLLIPADFMRYLTSLLERFRDKRDAYSDEAFSKFLNILRAISQRVLREMTDADREFFKRSSSSMF